MTASRLDQSEDSPAICSVVLLSRLIICFRWTWSTLYLDRTISPTRNNPPTIRSKSKRINPPCMTLVCVNASLLPHIPYFHVCIWRPRGKKFSKRVEIKRDTIWSVPSESSNNCNKKSSRVARYNYSLSFQFSYSKVISRLVHTFCFLNIPYFYCSACCSGAYHNLRGIKAHWLSWTCKTW